MFPELPQDLSALTDEELSALHDEFQEAGRKAVTAAKERDAEVLGERTQDEVETEIAAGVAALQTIRGEQKSREEADQQFSTKIEELEGEFGAAADDDKAELSVQSDDDEAEDDDEDEPEAETASAAKPAVKRSVPLAGKKHRPVEVVEDERGFRSQIRAEPFNVNYGDRLNERSIAEVLDHAVRRGIANPGTRLTVATARFPFPDSRSIGNRDGKQFLDGQDPKIRKAIDERQGALVASGGVCAPPEPFYEVESVAVPDRPVRDFLTSVEARRGAVIVRGALVMGDYDESVDHITAADNESAGSLAVKSCQRYECPDETTVKVDSISRCSEVDNLAARSDPELMAAINEQTMASWARIADAFLLTRMKALSTAVTGTGTAGNGGLAVHLASDIAKQASSYRNFNRMARGAELRAMAPDWLIDAYALDKIKAGAAIGGNAAQSRAAAEADVRALFAAFGVTVGFFLDSSDAPTNAQVFADQTAGATLIFPATIEWFLFTPGTFVHLDAGTLGLGIVRDSTLNATNDAQQFAESWENVAQTGIKGRVITSQMCPNGTFALAKDLSAVC